MTTLQRELQRLSGTQLDCVGAANVWAGVSGYDLQGALNRKAGTSGIATQGVLNRLAGTSGLAETEAARRIVVPAQMAAPTATATGPTTASVAFTPLVPTPINYTVTSSPGGVTAMGVSSPITVTGLSPATTYTFTIFATNAAGNGPASPASNAIVTLV